MRGEKLQHAAQNEHSRSGQQPLTLPETLHHLDFQKILLTVTITSR